MKQFKCTTEKLQDDKGELLNITLSGSLTLQSASDIKKALSEIKGSFESLIIKTKEVDSIDISFIQIVEAYRKTKVSEGVNVKIIMDLPYNAKTLLANAGIAYPSK